MSEEDYLFWTDISVPRVKKITYNTEIQNPLQHLKENYKNAKPPLLSVEYQIYTIIMMVNCRKNKSKAIYQLKMLIHCIRSQE